MTIAVIVCAYNEAPLLPASIRCARQRALPTRSWSSNASTDDTCAVAEAVFGVTVIDESMKGVVIARETARGVAHGDIVAYVDVDCRAPIVWLEMVRRGSANEDVFAVRA